MSVAATEATATLIGSDTTLVEILTEFTFEKQIYDLNLFEIKNLIIKSFLFLFLKNIIIL
jgi:hypothetical protein